jgi:sodium-dependent dicarboxylate transporter 2/3/5
VFATVALAWITRPLLAGIWPGITDAGIAISGALVLFALPLDWKRGVFILDWKSAVKLPWDVLLLLGGGLSLAQSIRETGLAEWLGHALSGLQAWPLLGIMLVVTLVLIFFTELTSNTASTAAFLPLLAALAIGIGESPLFLVVPAVIAASCAFMMPAATPPNAIVYGSGFITIPQMARMGIRLNVLFALLIPLFAYVLVAWVFGAQVGAVPSWATP